MAGEKAEGTKKDPADTAEQRRAVTNGDSESAELLKDLTGKAVALLLTAGGFAAFTAAVGAAILYARFAAAELPADQAVAAVPRGELISTGTTALAGFAVLGGLAVMVVYLIGPKGRPTRSMLYGLLVVLVVESTVVVALAHDAGQKDETVRAALILLGVLLLNVLLIDSADRGGCREWLDGLRKRVDAAMRASVATRIEGCLLGFLERKKRGRED